MPWNPEVYNQFKSIRFQPFFDLMDLIEHKPGMQAVDLGCGTGEQTAILAAHFKAAHFLGIDSSASMLAERPETTERLAFRQSTTEAWLQEAQTWDLVFSNAALQWSEDHKNLFPQMISKIRPGGQLAVQMPYQPGNSLNQLLAALAGEVPYKTQLKNWNRPSPVLTLDEYARILFENGMEQIQLVQKVYPIIAEDSDTLFRFISGSALIPYLERLDEGQSELFQAAFKARIALAFPKFPAIYAFKRLLIYGKRA
ncbi:MAG: methyltransferase domain-containing protein [Sphingobacteriales bacterium]|nr:MAG: methyltransferase domain-containing protein [Sphingobacteriales bacterium]